MLRPTRLFACVAAAAGLMSCVGAAAGVRDTGTQISVDPLTTSLGQHQTAVEPDSAAVGNTIVSVFQIGRSTAGAAAALALATSKDGGKTWQSGTLPGIATSQAEPGPFERVTDPAVAYDRVHRVWLVSMLALGKGEAGGVPTAILASRSVDGVHWEAPVVVVAAATDTGQDKDWLACDNGRRSRRAGHCYAVWTIPGFKADRLAVSESSDGGRTWSPERSLPVDGFAFVPLVRSNGAITLVYRRSHADILEARTSLNGLRTLSRPVRIAAFRDIDVPSPRSDVFPAAEIGADGREYVIWRDCRFRPQCGVDSLVISTSVAGTRWTPPRLVATGSGLNALEHILPAVAVDLNTRGARTLLAVMFYDLSPANCAGDACSVTAHMMFSDTAGRRWSRPQDLSPPMPLGWFPLTFGARFLGDYMATSFVPGRTAVAVYAAATSPFDGQFHQGIFAATARP